MKTDPKRVWIFVTLVAVILLIAQGGCNAVFQTGEDTSYLTPIPEETLWAYENGETIDSKLEAVILALRDLYTTRIHFAGPPRAIFVEKTSYGDAMQRVEKSAEQNLVDKQVWLVVFQGEYQIVPPGENPTPKANAEGCAFAIVSAAGGQFPSLGRIGTVSCESFQPE
jgi:hypothetical protein